MCPYYGEYGPSLPIFLNFLIVFSYDVFVCIYNVTILIYRSRNPVPHTSTSRYERKGKTTDLRSVPLPVDVGTVTCSDVILYC